jgi:hypothetical protein
MCEFLLAGLAMGSRHRTVLVIDDRVVSYLLGSNAFGVNHDGTLDGSV